MTLEFGREDDVFIDWFCSSASRRAIFAEIPAISQNANRLSGRSSPGAGNSNVSSIPDGSSPARWMRDGSHIFP